jgi:hypothetical protein
MKKLMLLAMLALSFLSVAAMADNPLPICTNGGCDWVR